MPTFRITRRLFTRTMALGMAGAALATDELVGQPARRRTRAGAAPLPEATLRDVPYGTHERQVLFFWKAEAAEPTPLVFVIHGGGWRGGDVTRTNRFVDVAGLLAAGISVVSIHYRYVLRRQTAGEMQRGRRRL